MDRRKLGRTELQVTTVGLGCGGYSRLGSRKYGVAHGIDIVRYAYDCGINLFDTAIQYETQPIVSAGLKGLPRDSYILSTKYEPEKKGNGDPGKFIQAVEKCLRELQTDYIDIFNMHMVSPQKYTYVKEVFYPAMNRLREQGKIRFIGITEDFFRDRSHEMMKMAVKDGLFDTLMIGYNILNPSAAFDVLPKAKEKDLGVMCMYAIRQTFRDPSALKAMLEDLEREGKIHQHISDLDFLVYEGWAKTLPDAACRFCANAEGIHTVLTGCGTREHLLENISSITGPPLPVEVEEKLREMFRWSDAVPEF